MKQQKHRLHCNRWFSAWVPLVGWMGIIFYLSAQPDLPKPESGLLGEILSTGAHVFEYGVLAFLWARALGKHSHTLLLSFGLALLYGFSDEFHQLFVPGRHCDPWDLLCDGLGAALGLVAWSMWRKWTGAFGGRATDERQDDNA